MKYQLVIELQCEWIDDYDRIVAIEDRLIELLAGGARVDGHDAGGGVMNLFIYTDAPRETFERAVEAKALADHLDEIRAGFRPVDGEEYTAIWPRDATEFALR